MKFKFNPKYTTAAVYCIFVFAICLLLAALVFKYSTFISYGRKIISVLSPVIWGICIAYILNPFMIFCERHYKKWFCKKKDRNSLTRSLAIATSLILFLGVITALIVAIIPEIKDTVTDFFRTLPVYLNNLQKSVTDIINRLVEWKPELSEYFDIEFSDIQDVILTCEKKIEPVLDDLFKNNDMILKKIHSSLISI
ncbi:MAG: AI-2E family transporter [Oscillospiraceae bacterium]|nr:AI-2E family transporter [Oscillospiraceae bacterium]